MAGSYRRAPLEVPSAPRWCVADGYSRATNAPLDLCRGSSAAMITTSEVIEDPGTPQAHQVREHGNHDDQLRIHHRLAPGSMDD